MTIRVTGPDDDGLLWIRADAGGLHGAVSVRAGSIAGRAFAAAGALPAPPSSGERERGATAPWYAADGSTVMLPAEEVERKRKLAAKVIEAARRVMDDLDNLHDVRARNGIDLGMALDELGSDPAPSRSERTEDARETVVAGLYRACPFTPGQGCRRCRVCDAAEQVRALPAPAEPQTTPCDACWVEAKGMVGSRPAHEHAQGCRERIRLGIDAPQTTPAPEGAAPCGGSRCWLAPEGTWIHSSKSYDTCSAARLSTEGAAVPGKEDESHE